MPRRRAPLGIMGDTIRNPLKPLNTIVLIWSEGFQWGPHLVPGITSLSVSCTSDHHYSFSSRDFGDIFRGGILSQVLRVKHFGRTATEFQSDKMSPLSICAFLFTASICTIQENLIYAVRYISVSRQNGGPIEGPS